MSHDYDTDRVAFPETAWPLFRKALEHIAGNPDEFYMGTWIINREIIEADYADFSTVEEYTQAMGRPLPECGTAACLAGHIALAYGVEPSVVSDDENDRYTGVYDVFDDSAALRYLGIDPGTPTASNLREVFGMTHIDSYAALREVLEERFVFPEPLPGVVA